SEMMNPSVGASEYAGAVEATPMTMLERKPIAFFFRPLSGTATDAPTPGVMGTPVAAMLSVAIGFSLARSRTGPPAAAPSVAKLLPGRCARKGRDSQSPRRVLYVAYKSGRRC